MGNLSLERDGRLSLSNLSIEEIESLGADIQFNLSAEVGKLLSSVRCVNVGEAGRAISDLTKRQGRMIAKLEPKMFKRFWMNTRSWLSQYESVEQSVDHIGNLIESEVSKLNTILNGCYANIKMLRGKLEDLESVEKALEGIISSCDSSDSDDIELKLKACRHRLDMISLTIALTNQEIMKSMLIIEENKEITYQLEEASHNLVPMLKIMMMNVLSSRVNAEAVVLKRTLTKVANQVVLDNAREVAKTAHDLMDGRFESLISPKTLSEANMILQRTLDEVILRSNKVASEAVIEGLKESSSKIEGYICRGM